MHTRNPALLVSLLLALSCSNPCSDENKEARETPAIQPVDPAAALFDQDGTLTPGGATFPRSTHDIPVNAGDQLDVVLTADAFDPVLVVTPPQSGALTNDDFEGNRHESRLSVIAQAGGVMKVTVTSIDHNASGAYHLRVTRAVAAPQAQRPVPSAEILTAGNRREGEITAADGALPDGRFSEMIMVAGADQGAGSLRIEARGDSVPLANFLSPAGLTLSPSEAGVYAITQPGVHRLQLIAPTAGQPANYALSVSAPAAQVAAVTPNLQRPHHQLPSQGGTETLAIGQTINATMGGGMTLPSGEPAAIYTLNGTTGEEVRIEQHSDAFDSYLMVLSPSGQFWENDDVAGTLHSAVDLTLPETGAYRIVASAYQAGMSGAFSLKASHATHNTQGNANLANTQPPPSAPAAAPNAETTRTGQLAQGDRTIDSGEFIDSYPFTFNAGQPVTIGLQSTEFDTYLIVRAPDGEQQDNDDISQENRNSQVAFTPSATGAYTVLVTSYQPGETGNYTLTVSNGSGQAAPAQPSAPATPPPTAPAQPTTPAPAGQVISGQLAQGDQTLDSGEFSDIHAMTFEAGQTIHFEARSTAFDTYLIVREPGGQQHDNDDGPAGGTNAALDLTTSVAGEYQVVVTSYRPGETGAYELVVGGSAATPAANPGATPPPSNPGATPPPANPANNAAGATPATGDRVAGALAQGDQTLQSGEFADRYSRTFTAGDSVQIRLNSSAIDPYLIVRTPSGQQLDNDDISPSDRNSGIDIPSAEPGTYGITVTSYQPGETGAYELSFGRGASIPRPGGGGDGGQIYGLFVGITDYPDGVGDLPECANDAIKLAEALRQRNLLDESRQVLLTDAQATRANVTAAMQRFAREMGPEDIFVFFYSGHGGQNQGATDPREIDGTDEYLVLHDGPLVDNDLATQFDALTARISMVAIDACFAGGFAKDIITRPGRIGFFSSEEDVLSAVAGQFQAGGYLSHFIRLAVSGEADSAPRDQVLTVGELSHFLYTQFGRHATDVQLQGAFQHLVVDRGAVRSDQVLWSYR